MKKQKSNKLKTDRQIIDYISRKIWNWDTNTEEDLKDIIQEALQLKSFQIIGEINSWDEQCKKRESGNLDNDIEELKQRIKSK